MAIDIDTPKEEELNYHYKYPHPSVTTDCVIFGFDGRQLRVLLIRRGVDPYKDQWAFPGGFIKIDESAEQGALRELREETGLETAYIKQFHTFSEPGRDPRERVITIAYYALVKLQDVLGCDDAAEARWWPIDEIPPLAFDHEEILKTALKELKREIYFEPVGFELLPEKFTIREMQTLYEAILNVKFDRRNFYNKLRHTAVVNQLNASANPSSKRPTFLFNFNAKNYEIMKDEDGLRTEF